jgi:hypothetical protein
MNNKIIIYLFMISMCINCTYGFEFFNTSVLTEPYLYVNGMKSQVYDMNITLENGTELFISNVKTVRMYNHSSTIQAHYELNKIYSYLYNTALYTQNILCKGNDIAIEIKCDKNSMAYCYKCIENGK